MAPTDLPSTDDPVPVPDGPHEWRCLAELCGARGPSVRVSGELDDALADALAANDPALVHVRTDVWLV